MEGMGVHIERRYREVRDAPQDAPQGWRAPEARKLLALSPWQPHPSPWQ